MRKYNFYIDQSILNLDYNQYWKNRADRYDQILFFC